MSTSPDTPRPPVRVRLVGPPDSVAAVLVQLAHSGAEVSASAMYPSRYSTTDVRIYAEITPSLGTEK
ncbi:hypothetical protein [Nocardia brevicatena]|uniref:hypothetical protein n=1 Tax=Nocardia brevicatena TaxID=37327 RepID=UPI0005943324|nr:hypothetical protein [Nocardia brevicatena]